MQTSVRRAALSAAAKLAFSVASVAGCGGPRGDAASKGSPPPVACGSLLDAAFPGEDRYPGTPMNVSREVQECCADSVIPDRHPQDGSTSMKPHRWACCANLPPLPADATHGAMCSPWGPPVPPATNARSERRAFAGIDLGAAARAARPVVPDLPHLRASAIATWSARMANEHASSRVFEALARQLRRAGMAREVVTDVLGFAEDERRHGVLCGAVVDALGGDAHVGMREEPIYPAHHDVDPLEGALRNVLGICCLSETVAVALIGAERLAMPASALRDLLTRIYSDEVGHARFGWRLLEALSIDRPMKERLTTYLALAFGGLEAHELAHLPIDARSSPEGAALGLCDGADARSLFLETVTEVIVPALESHGFGAGEAWKNRHSRHDLAGAVGA